MSTLKITKLQKQLDKLQDKYDRTHIMHELELDRLNTHWSKKFDMIVGMFEVQAAEAGTISELRKWFKEWTTDVNGIDANCPDAGDAMADIIEKHGFEFRIRPINVTHREILGVRK